MLSRRIRALRVALSCALLAFAVAPAAAQPIEKFNEAARVYARFDWDAQSSPNFVGVGSDQFLVSVKGGVKVWDALGNTLRPLKDWPYPPFLSPLRAAIEGGALFIAGWVDFESQTSRVQRMRGAVLGRWSNRAGRVIADLNLPPDFEPRKMLRVSSQHALLCGESISPGNRHGHPAVYLVDAGNEKLRLGPIDLPAAQAALRQGGFAGDAPIVIDPESCDWKFRVAPEMPSAVEWRAIDPHRLPDGRLIIGSASWTGAATGKQARALRNIESPLLWDPAGGRWQALDAPPEVRGRRMEGYGLDDPLISGDCNGGLSYFFDASTFRWTRSWQFAPQLEYCAREVPLSDGSYLVFEDAGGRAFRLHPLRDMPPNQFAYAHGRFNAVPLRDGGALLTGWGFFPRPIAHFELLAAPSFVARQTAPPPKLYFDAAGVELADRSIVLFGGLGGDCRATLISPKCRTSPALPAYRFDPATNRWDAISELAVPFAFGESWNSDLTRPRTDFLLRPGGDLFYLRTQRAAGELLPDSSPDSLSSLLPVETTLLRWRIGAAPEAVAALRKGRTEASLLQLADGRIATIGGSAQLEIMALEKDCRDCPNAFVSLGPMRPARSTEVLDEQRRAWLTGPTAHYPGGRALVLENGRVFKLSRIGPTAAEGYRAEIADAAFTHWDKLPPFPVAPYDVRDLAVVGNRVLVLPEAPHAATVVWDDARTAWSVWENWPTAAPDYRSQALSVKPADGQNVRVRRLMSLETLAMPP